MRTKSLAFLAGIIWLTAGFNVCRIGVVSWMSTDATTVVMILGCRATMVVFSRMFVRMGSPDKPGGEIPQTKRKVIHLHHEHTRTFSIGAVDSAIRDTFKL